MMKVPNTVGPRLKTVPAMQWEVQSDRQSLCKHLSLESVALKLFKIRKDDTLVTRYL